MSREQKIGWLIADLCAATAIPSCGSGFLELTANWSRSQQRGTAFGWYHLVSGVLILPGALLFGSLWEWAGSAVAFGTAAGVTLVAAIMLLASARARES